MIMRTRLHIVGEYLRELERCLSDFPPGRRNEIVSEIEDHIEGLLAELGDGPTEAEIRNLLERVGDPDEVAAEARAGTAAGASDAGAGPAVTVAPRLGRRWLVALIVLALALPAAAVVAVLVLGGGGERGLDFSRSTIHFGDQVVGGRSKAQTITVTQRGGQTSIAEIRIDGENPGDFHFTDASTCAPGPLEEGVSCTVVVRFVPTEQGERLAMLGVLGLDGGKEVELSGTGNAASR
jgi:hypothetical protein